MSHYEGWPNYQTLIAYQWLTRDIDSQSHCQNLLRLSHTLASVQQDVKERLSGLQQAVRDIFADLILTHLQQSSPVSCDSFYGRLLQVALDDIDYDEIANRLLVEFPRPTER